MTQNGKSSHNISSLPKAACFGCAACESICPKDCITMQPDHEGFLYPIVDEDQCIACRKCIDVCPGFNQVTMAQPLPDTRFIGGKILDESIRYQSSSGGMFSLVADHILGQNGVVYGAVIQPQDMRVVHARAVDPDGLQAMRKSKYVQSDTTKIFPRVQQDLSTGRPVLFTGTPCQVAGLYLYLGQQPDNLFTCDIICHGVPSPGLFQNHFGDVEDRMDAPIHKIDFRTKEKGWGSFLNFYLAIETDHKKRLVYAPLDAYYALFLANLSLRPVCYTCKYATTPRTSDLTLGDFWGVQRQAPDLFDGKGTSLLLVNTTKGQRLVDATAPRTKLKMLSAVVPMPPNLVRPTPKPKSRDRFFETIDLRNWKTYRFRAHLTALFTIVKNKLRAVLQRL